MFRVSVVVPVYNVEQYLTSCLDSLLNQSIPFFEIVLVDDGSTDSSGAICDEYSSRYSNIGSFHKSNEGLGFARNTGLEHVSKASDYVMFVDSDDWLEITALESMLDCLMRYGSLDCVLSGFVRKNDSNDVLETTQLDNSYYEGSAIREQVIPRICGGLPNVGDAIPMSACGVLYSMDIIRHYGLQFPSERALISEDFVFNLQYLVKCSRVFLSDTIGYCYRVNRNSLTTSYREDRFEACLHFYDAALGMLERFGLSDECRIRFQKSFFIYIRMCISQEKSSVSGKTLHKAKHRIKEIVSNTTVQEAISHYPLDELGFKQKAFLLLVHNQRSLVLALLSNMGMI